MRGEERSEGSAREREREREREARGTGEPEVGELEAMDELPSDSVDLIGETAASDALTDHEPIGPSEAESRNALGATPVMPAAGFVAPLPEIPRRDDAPDSA